MNFVHTPVLLEAALNLLNPRFPNELMIDATTGEAGFSYQFLLNNSDLYMICIDADSQILEIAKKRLSQFGDRVKFFNCWSSEFFASYPETEKKPNTILIDLGVSLYHYKMSGRGFSFEKDEYLDMRIDTTRGETAADLIAKLSEKELADLIYAYAQEKYSRRIAARIVNERQRGRITTTKALAGLIESAVPASYSQRSFQRRRGKVHAATKTFQALRIAVNGELVKLHGLLEAALGVLEPGGRLGVISFHSLEDKIVKDFFRLMNKDCTCKENVPICKCEGIRKVNILTKKGITAEKDEIKRNPPSRSARLRVVEKLAKEGGM